MTYQRVLNRNRLRDGDYNAAPASWMNAGEQSRLLAGDLRRLERDAVDENGICKYIAGRLQLEAEVVAAVLKEFMDW